jgi:pSer/pThr/pTyr-binding forkhead associated (FHA) protein
VNKIIVRHLTGSRAHQVDQFPGGANEIVFGREPGVTVQYDEKRDGLVSRRHVKITVDSVGKCRISDLQSRNGVFLNNQRLFGEARLSHNDRVQLGAGGPEFRFEIDPPPSANGTRETGGGALGATSTTPKGTPTEPSQATLPIGSTTVERILDANFNKAQSKSTKLQWFAYAAAGIVLMAGLLFYIRLNSGDELRVRQQQQLLQQLDQQLTPTDQADPVFEQHVKTVLTAVKTNPIQAVQGAADLISQYPNRWESYGVAGVIFRSQHQLPQAKSAYERALTLAPENVKPELTAAIQQIDARSGAVSQ